MRIVDGLSVERLCLLLFRSANERAVRVEPAVTNGCLPFARLQIDALPRHHHAGPSTARLDASLSLHASGNGVQREEKRDARSKDFVSTCSSRTFRPKGDDS